MSNANVGKVFNMTGGNGNMLSLIYDPQGKKTDVYEYIDNAVLAAIDNLYSNLLSEQAIYHVLYDSSGDPILDSASENIQARIAVAIK